MCRLSPHFAIALCDSGKIAEMPWGTQGDMIRHEVAIGSYGFDHLTRLLECSRLEFEGSFKEGELRLNYRRGVYQFHITQIRNEVELRIDVFDHAATLFVVRITYGDGSKTLALVQKSIECPAFTWQRAKSFFEWAKADESLNRNEFIQLTPQIYDAVQEVAKRKNAQHWRGVRCDHSVANAELVDLMARWAAL